MEYEPVRFNEMRRYLGNISDKTLSQNLKELEADELITRTVYAQIPPKVEYHLTDRGNSLVKILDKLTGQARCDWINTHNTSSKQFKPNDWKNAGRPSRQVNMLPDVLLKEKLEELMAD